METEEYYRSLSGTRSKAGDFPWRTFCRMEERVHVQPEVTAKWRVEDFYTARPSE